MHASSCPRSLVVSLVAALAWRAGLGGALVLAAGCNTVLGYAAGEPAPAGAGGSTGGIGDAGSGGAGGAGGGSGGLGRAIKLIDVVRTADESGLRPGGARPIPAMPDVGRGTLCWRVQVLAVPSTDHQCVQFCFWQEFLQLPEMCDEGRGFSGPGIYLQEVGIDELWLNQGEPFDLAVTGNETQAMFKVGDDCQGPLTVAPGGPCPADFCYDGELGPYVPRRARETAYLVPEGQSCPDLDVVAAQTEPLEL